MSVQVFVPDDLNAKHEPEQGSDGKDDVQGWRPVLAREPEERGHLRAVRLLLFLS